MSHAELVAQARKDDGPLSIGGALQTNAFQSLNKNFLGNAVLVFSVKLVCM